jgi:hypothetical protein
LFPRFFGITNTFRPVFSPPEADEDEDAPEVAPEVEPEPEDELEPEELHAASRSEVVTSGTARTAVCLSFM